MAASNGLPELNKAQMQIYLGRIGLSTDAAASVDLEALKAITAAHLCTIPFENCSLVHPHVKLEEGKALPLDLAAVFEKLVLKPRGGYCFEQNALMAAALRAAGYDLYTSAARVVAAQPDDPDQVALNGTDHQIIILSVDGQKYVVDVGFGSGVPPGPVLLEETSDAPEGRTHRVRRGFMGNKEVPQSPEQHPQRQGWYMQRWSHSEGGWTDSYYFQEVEFRPRDYEVAHWFITTHPESFFRKGLVLSISTEKGRITLSDTSLKVFERESDDPASKLDVVLQQELQPGIDLDDALAEYFGIAFY